MQIEYREIGDIVPYEKNPRQNGAAVAAVAASLREFGWQQPVVVDQYGVILAGHTRYRAALELGLKEVPVHVARDLTEAQARERGRLYLFFGLQRHRDGSLESPHQ